MSLCISGQGPGLNELLGTWASSQGGATSVTLLESEMPLHNHFVQAKWATPPPANAVSCLTRKVGSISGDCHQARGGTAYTALANTAADGPSNDSSNERGGSLPHNNMMPFLTLNFCIACCRAYFHRAAELDAAPARRRATRPSCCASTRARARRSSPLVPWSAEQKEAFVAQQFAAQTAHYAQHYAGMSADVIVRRRRCPPGGCSWRALADEILIVDIALLPEFRGSGIGTALLGDLLAEADAAGKRVTIHVERFNPALAALRAARLRGRRGQGRIPAARAAARLREHGLVARPSRQRNVSDRSAAWCVSWPRGPQALTRRSLLRTGAVATAGMMLGMRPWAAAPAAAAVRPSPRPLVVHRARATRASPWGPPSCSCSRSPTSPVPLSTRRSPGARTHSS